MTYRPLISDSVHERVQLYMVGKNGSANKVYEDAMRSTISKEGDMHEWRGRGQQYADSQDKEPAEVLDDIITSVIDEDGEPNIKFKGPMDL